MTLRLRLFALLVALAALLAVGEWGLVRSLSLDLEEELAAAAASVSQDVLRLLRMDTAPPAAGLPATGKLERRILIVRDHEVVSTTAAGATRTSGAAEGPRAPATGGKSAVDSTAGAGGRLPDSATQASGGSPPAASTPGSGTTGAPLDTASTSPPPQEADGVIELHAVAPDGTVIDERHQVRARFAGPRSSAHVMLLRGDKGPQSVPVPTSGVRHAVERFTRRLLLASLALFGGALLLGVAVTHRFTRPLRDLAAAARRVGGGDLGVVAPAAPGEVGEAVAAFNQMSRQLAALDEETRRLRASEQLSELGEVGRGLAHSLRNPLNALGLALDQLAEHAGAADGRDESLDAAADNPTAVAASARRQIRRIDAALRGFLALAAADAVAGDVDLVAVARDVALEALQTRPAGAAAPRVEVVAAARALPLRGVEAELRAALQALVVNAIEASPAGVPVVISIGPAEAATSVTITVDDAGGGVPAAVRSRLFTPHVTTKPAGAGMGLYLAHRIATTRYAGALELVDRPGGGTRATLLLHPRATFGEVG